MLAYYNATTLSILGVCAFFYLNHMNRRTPHLKRWGVVLITAGAFCEAISWFVPGRPEEAELLWIPSAVLHAGLALVSVAVIRGEISEYFNCIRERWNGHERREEQRRHAGD